MKVKVRARRCCRRAGGLAVGASLHFPVQISGPKKLDGGYYVSEVFDCTTLMLGFVFWQVFIDFKYGYYFRGPVTRF